jgi:hypothetical protein
MDSHFHSHVSVLECRTIGSIKRDGGHGMHLLLNVSLLALGKYHEGNEL